VSGSTDPVIEIAGLRKAFDGTEALAGIDLAAEAGRVLALLGPNGAGKTTLVRIRAHGAAIVGKAGYILSCIVASLALVTSGFAYYVKAQVVSIGGSDAISGGPSVGAMNILLMGLESRTDYQGNVLPADLLAAMHAGSVQGVEDDGVGGQDTNTLILIHVFAGGQKAVGFEHEGVLTSFSQLTSLLDIAKKYVITDSDWQILDFATEMHALSGRNLTFLTLPVQGYQTFYLGGTAEDANVINIPAIQAQVKQAFTAPATSSGKKSRLAETVTYPLSATTVDVYNAGYTGGLAGNVSAGLVAAGFAKGQVANTTIQSTTEVLYGSGAAAKANAARIAALFGVTAQAGSSVSAGHVEVVLGTSATLPSFSSMSPGSSASSPASSSSPSPSSISASSNGAAGGVVSVSANARYGIPCVY